MLKVRRFVLGIDEADWLKVQNAVFAVRVDIAPMSVEKMRNMEKSPDFDSEGRFIAESDNKPVGIIHAYVDKLREEKKGKCARSRAHAVCACVSVVHFLSPLSLFISPS